MTFDLAYATLLAADAAGASTRAHVEAAHVALPSDAAARTRALVGRLNARARNRQLVGRARGPLGEAS